MNLLEKLAQVPGMSRKGKQMYTRTLVGFTLKGHTDPPQPDTDPLSGFAQNYSANAYVWSRFVLGW